MQPWLRAKISGVQFIPDGLIFNLGHQRTAFGYILAIIFSRFAIFAGWTGIAECTAPEGRSCGRNGQPVSTAPVERIGPAA